MAYECVAYTAMCSRKTFGRCCAGKEGKPLLEGGDGKNDIEGSGEEEGEGENLSSPDKGKDGNGALRKDMNLIDAIAFVVSDMIGSGIFITPAIILRETGSFGVSMLCWLVGMVISILGALCYIELGLLIPKTGGEYVYILHAFTFRKQNKWLNCSGSLVAFLYTWTATFITGPCATAIVTLTCARYLTRPFFIGCEIPVSVLKILSLFIISKAISYPLATVQVHVVLHGDKLSKSTVLKYRSPLRMTISSGQVV